MQLMKDKEEGHLYIVATPIGNMEDITIRALKVLSEVDLILCEDTRKTKRLLSHHKIRNKVTSFHSYNEDLKANEILSLIKEGKNIALVSDSGTPCISDPGITLVRSAQKQGLKVYPIPGPSALAASVSVSGASSNKVLFFGFLPKIKSRRIKEFLLIKNLNLTTVIYESPKRVRKTLTDISNFIPGRDVFVIREMTKLYEESFLGSPKEVLQRLPLDAPKGEFCVIIYRGENKTEWDDKKIKMRAKKMLRKFSLSAKDTAKLLSNETGIPKKRIYKMVSDLKSHPEDFENE